MKPVNVEDLKNQLRARGIDPDPYVSAILQFQKLVSNIKTHDELDVVHKLLQCIVMVLTLKHAKFHAEGGQDERASSPFN